MSNQNYRLEEKNSKKIDVHLLYITEAKYEQDWHSLAHTHHFTELFFITHGTGKFTIENECFPVKENDLIIVNPNVSTQNQAEPALLLNTLSLGSTDCNLRTRTNLLIIRFIISFTTARSSIFT